LIRSWGLGESNNVFYITYQSFLSFQHAFCRYPSFCGIDSCPSLLSRILGQESQVLFSQTGIKDLYWIHFRKYLEA
jgi:hypothetical protein